MRPVKGYTPRPVRAPVKPRRRYAPRRRRPVEPGSGCLRPSPVLYFPPFYAPTYGEHRELDRAFGFIRSIYGNPRPAPARRPPLPWGIAYQLALREEMPF